MPSSLHPFSELSAALGPQVPPRLDDLKAPTPAYFSVDGGAKKVADWAALRVYNISNNQITGSAFMGLVGLDWQFAGVAPIRVPGASDLVLRNVNTGEFQVYNIANNQITGSAPLGTVGTDWQLGGFAPTASNGFMRNSGGPLASQPAAGSTSQLVQAMAGFGGGGGAADG
jgi:hypothetical protein